MVSYIMHADMPRVCRVLEWAGYMQKDLEQEPPSSASSVGVPEVQDVEEKVIFRDNIAGSSSNPVVQESSAARFFDGDSLPLTPDRGHVSEWDLRASMETKRWFERDYEQWQKHNEETIGNYPFVASDWRTDLRIQESLDPAEVDYREWTMKEIWDLITQNGEAADPRDIPFEVRKPGSRTNFVTEGYVHHPDIPEWLEAQGKLMHEQDAKDIVDDEAEAALLTSEFSDFDNDFDFSNEDD